MTVTAVRLRPVPRGNLAKLWIGVALLLAAGLALAWHTTAGVAAMYGSAEDFLSHNARQAGVETTASGLQYRVIEEGQGPSPEAGDFALVNYEGMFRTGESFDAGESVPFALGEPLPGINAVSPVDGFKEALGLMSTGARYRVWLPPELAYGDNPPPGSGIEPGDVIVFDIEMLEFVSRNQLIMGLMQMQQQGAEGAPPPGAEGAAPPVPGQ